MNMSDDLRRHAALRGYLRASATLTAGPVERQSLTPPARPGSVTSFDRLAVLYDRFSFLVGRELWSYLTARLPARGGRAVDLGCGTGRHATLLARHFDHVLAVDIC